MSKQQIDEYYNEFMENVQESASDDVRKGYSNMCGWFDEYLSAVQEDMFRQAFQYGYEQGLKEATIRKTA